MTAIVIPPVGTQLLCSRATPVFPHSCQVHAGECLPEAHVHSRVRVHAGGASEQSAAHARLCGRHRQTFHKNRQPDTTESRQGTGF